MRSQLLLFALPFLSMALPISSPEATASVSSTSEDSTFIWRRGEVESKAALQTAEDRIFTWRRGNGEERADLSTAEARACVSRRGEGDATYSTAEDRSFTWRRVCVALPLIADDDSAAQPQIREENPKAKSGASDKYWSS